MKKTLITKSNVSDYLKDNTLCVKKDYIISPLALDELKASGVEIIYEDQIDDMDNTICEKVEDILREDHKIVDKTTISNVQSVVLKVLNIK